MHPAYSVIVFTTASGAGLGLLVWLAVFGLFDRVPTERWLGLAGFAAAFILITGGLLSSSRGVTGSSWTISRAGSSIESSIGSSSRPCP